MWAVREPASAAFVGITGLERRPDGRGVALRFALWPEAQGRGLAREAAGAALRFGHSRPGCGASSRWRVNNFASRMVLGGIGMTECGSFLRQGWCMRDCTRASLSRLCHLLAHRVDQRVDIVVVTAQIGRVVLTLGQAQ